MRRKRLKYFKSLSDKELLEAVMNNDEDAIEYLLFYRCDKLFSFIIRRTFSSNVKKEELITEFYLFLRKNGWEKLRRFKFLSSLDTWLSTVLVRFFDEKKKNVATTDDKAVLLDENIVEYEEDNAHLMHFELLDAINSIENARYKYVLLSEWKGMKSDEIARSMGVSIENVYTISKRAKAELKKLIDGRYVRKNG
ncbi:MAG: sigma factor-like helix-turn-helix DNA-binding protein [Bacteroidia bacterium]|nr:sigma factor-like helix-turn-helix DNA-binding protein [Bacteroidia bacterium]